MAFDLLFRNARLPEGGDPVEIGVSGGRIAAVGMGARQPVSKGATERAKAQNRRVEIFIYPAN